MRTFRIDAFDAQGRARIWDRAWGLYAAFAMETPTLALVRIGISADVFGRVLQLRPPAGLPIATVLWAACGTRSKAAHVQLRLAHDFSARRRGDWLTFNVAAPEEKDSFHTAARTAFRVATGGALKWTVLTRTQLDAYQGLEG